jgi:GAF domain-containing protein
MLMVDEKTNELYYPIAAGEQAQSLKHLRIPMGEGVAGWVAASGTTLIVPDVSIDAQWSAFSRAHPELNIQAIACIPIRSGDKTLGVIQLLERPLGQAHPRAHHHRRLHQPLQRAPPLHHAG